MVRAEEMIVSQGLLKALCSSFKRGCAGGFSQDGKLDQIVQGELKEPVGIASYLVDFAMGFAVATGGTGFVIASVGYGSSVLKISNEIDEKQDDTYFLDDDIFHESSPIIYRECQTIMKDVAHILYVYEHYDSSTYQSNR